ncbi:MAG: YbdK family carboxylate-amine ligase [Pirellulales bacterium]
MRSSTLGSLPLEPLTLGVEEEFQILCPDTWALVPAFDALHACSLSLPHRVPCSQEIQYPEMGSRESKAWAVKSELHQSCCEVVTRPCRSVDQLLNEVRSNRQQLFEIARQTGLRVGLSGAHPASCWSDLPITREPRRLLSEQLFQEAHRQCLAFALHIHVGVPDRNLALRVMNDARTLLPILYALSCSSPLLEGRNSGLMSSRMLRAFGFPRTGIPDAFHDLDELDRLMNTLLQAGVIADAGQIWWDIRIHHKYPTVEFRLCDAVPLLQDVASLAALIQAFVGDLLASYEKGYESSLIDRTLLCENRWRAARFGTKAKLIDYSSGKLEPLGKLVGRLCQRLEPQASQLGMIDHLHRNRNIACHGSAAERQLALWEKGAEWEPIVRQYVAETEAV